MHVIASLVAREDHRLKRNAVGGCPGLNTHGVADGTAAELQHDVLAEQIEKLMHLPGVNAAGRHGHQLVEAGPGLIEEDAMFQLQRIEVLPADVVVAARGVGVAFQLADDRAGVDVVDAGEPHFAMTRKDTPWDLCRV